MNPAEVLREAADLIRFNGLAKGSFADEDGRLCTMGAVKLASKCGQRMMHTRDYSRSLNVLKNYIWSQNGTFAIAWWNDMPERTADEVIDVLTMAAKDYENNNVLQ